MTYNHATYLDALAKLCVPTEPDPLPLSMSRAVHCALFVHDNWENRESGIIRCLIRKSLEYLQADKRLARITMSNAALEEA